jgi:DNA-binding cell septation regulator SpoVG
MKIENVKIRPIENNPRLKAIVSVSFDEALYLNDLKVIQTGKRLCIEFPENPKQICPCQSCDKLKCRDRQCPDLKCSSYQQYAFHREHSIVPMRMDVRNMFESVILAAYEKKVHAQDKKAV